MVIGISLIFVGLVVYVIFGPELGKKEMALVATKNEVLSEVNQTKEYVNKTAKWMEETGEETDIGYFNPPDEHKENEDPKVDVLKYFITGLIANDMDIFLSSFNPESISRDLFQSDVEDKTKVAEEIMNRISRDGQINDVQYKVEKGGFKTGEKNKLAVTITYKDEQSANFKLDILPMGDSHHDDKDSIYVISTSAWELIEQIEKSTN